MQLGDRVARIPSGSLRKNDAGNLEAPVLEWGRVVYLHPKGRFFVLRFDCGFCEAYPFKEVDQDGEA